MKCCIFLPVLLNLVYCQQLIDLKSFRGGNVQNAIVAHAPYDVFVSATSDDMDLLSQVKLVTQDGKSITLHELKNRKPFLTTSQIQPYPVQTSAYITTSLTDDQMNTLTGVMFISTTNQLQINNFHVIDIDKAQNYYLPDQNQTVLFLNTNMATTPFQSTTVSAWSQPDTSSVYVYQGIPTDLPEKNSSFIFSNPVSTTKGAAVFVKNVEKFSLSLGAFYIKYYGEVAFSVTPEYYDADNSNTTFGTTTGFYMKAVNQKEKTIQIRIMRNQGVNGTTGANIIGALPTGGNVTVAEFDNQSSSQTTITPTGQILGWSTNTIGQILQISSENSVAGEYFVQYYVIQTAGNQGSTTTSKPIQTTTKVSSFSTFNIVFLVLAFCNLFG